MKPIAFAESVGGPFDKTAAYRASGSSPISVDRTNLGAPELDVGKQAFNLIHKKEDCFGVKHLKSLELFAGGGGLGIGLSHAGFKPEMVVEWDKWSCDTLRRNIERGFPLVHDWNVVQGDVRELDFAQLNDIDLISGGPPCQPFSLAGKHKAYNDERDLFPAAINAVRKLRPRAFIFENVRGITRPAFANYFQYINLQLKHPLISKKPKEEWGSHLRRLEAAETKGRRSELSYNVVSRVVNAADYGVPQRRDRVFIVGFRADQGADWSFPVPTHSKQALLVEQFVTQEYWERHKISKRSRPSTDAKTKKALQSAQLELGIEPQAVRPWRTVRDALIGMPHPKDTKRRNEFSDHIFQGGAKVYPGHTGSPLDLPAKTLKAGDHGVPGGENMLVADDGTVRYFTVREAARLQCFPDGWKFHGAWSEVMRQLGNAVPVRLAEAIGSSVATKLLERDWEELKMRASSNG